MCRSELCRAKDTCFFFQAEDGIRDYDVTGVQTCALPICGARYFDQESGVIIKRRIEEVVEGICKTYGANFT